MEIWIAVIAGLIGTGGVFTLIIKYAFEYYTKKAEFKRIKELREMDHPLKESLRGIDAQYDLVYETKDSVRADTVLLLRISNGDVFADKSHKWAFTATIFVGNDKIRQVLQNRSIYEAGEMFAILEREGMYWCKSTEKCNSVLSNRLNMLGIRSFCTVSTESCLNIMLLCWTKEIEFKKSSSIVLKSDLQSIEEYIK